MAQPAIPDSAIVPDGFSIFRQDRTATSGESKGGGVCVMTNNNWCSDVKIISSDCSAQVAPHDLMSGLPSAEGIHICCDNSSVYPAAATRRQQHGTRSAVWVIIDKTETSRPDAAFVVAGDFNTANMKKVLPKILPTHQRPDARRKHTGPCLFPFPKWI